MGRSIDKITLKGFKSIRSLEDFELQDVEYIDRSERLPAKQTLYQLLPNAPCLC